MPAARDLLFNRPSLFTPSVVRAVRQTGGGDNQSFTLSQMSSSALSNSSSYRYNTQGSGLQSTQQLNVDWSDFSAHVFFNSAQVKVNSSVQKIFDTFPFDGTQEESEVFFDKLTGYEKYLYDLFPKNVGYLFFSGTNSGYETGRGTHVTTKDLVGSDYPLLVRSATGRSVLNPGLSSMTTEFHFYAPPVSSSNQVILQKVSSSVSLNDQGFGIFMYNTGSTSFVDLAMVITSGSYTLSSSAVQIPKGSFNHIAFVWDRTPGVSRIYSFVNQELKSTSDAIEIGNLLFDGAPLTIGSGSQMGGFTPTNTLSGAIDELRIWHSARTQEERSLYFNKNVYASDDLKLYYKFNEPSGSATQIVLDHSGKGLHGTLNSYAANTLGVREIATSSIAGISPIKQERLSNNPVLFSSVPSVAALTTRLLTSASIHDSNNPNWIVNLVPPHMLLDGQYQDALGTVDGEIVDLLNYGTAGIRDAKLGESQVLLLLMYTWAKYYDELKLYLDAFGNMMFVDYNNVDTIPDEFLQTLGDRFGIKLPSLFTNSSVQQFINAENINEDGSQSLLSIQNAIWRRILINIKDVLDSKGTIHSVKTFIRSIGIDPDNNFRIREFGGPTKRTLDNSREQRSEAAGMLSFVDGNGFVSSPWLSASRTEPGWPSVAGTSNDGLLTSGSWTVEGIYKFERPIYETQSLLRLQTTGSQVNLVANLLALSGSGVTLYARPHATSSAAVLSMSLSGFNPMDGQLWSVSFGRSRGDELGQISSSYFLRAAKQSFGKITEEHTTSVFFNDTNVGDNVWAKKNSTYNPSGSYIAFGSQSLGTSAAGTFLNDDALASTTNMDGKVAQLRFWSKALTTQEWREHVRNPKSLGVTNPKSGFNFVTNESGSFGRLRLDVSLDQPITRSTDLGLIQLFDYSQNNLHLSGVRFPATSSVVVPQTFYYSHWSSHFDDGATTNKVRIRSYQDFDNVLNDEGRYAQVAPVYDIEKSEEPQDSAKFSIDMSVVDMLNQDIVNMFSSLDSLNDVLGGTEQMFSSDYGGLEHLRNVYFNRLTDKIQIKVFFDFYKWFDANIGNFITQLVPRKTKFLGTNYVVQSHMLERPKIEYQFSDMYLGDDSRHGQKDTITLQQFTGNISKF